MEKEAEAQRKIQDKEARLDRLKEIMASRGQQPRTPMVSRGRHAAAATPSTTRAERAVWFFIFFLIVSFCRKRRFMRLRPNRQNRLNQTISRFFQALLTYNTLDRFLILCNENKIYLKSCANIICLITKNAKNFSSYEPISFLAKFAQTVSIGFAGPGWSLRWSFNDPEISSGQKLVGVKSPRRKPGTFKTSKICRTYRKTRPTGNLQKWVSFF